MARARSAATSAKRGRSDARRRKPPAISADAARARIRGCGLRATAPRIAVLRCLGGRTTPASHAELAAELARDGWDRATVYRNLMDLTEASLVRRTDLGDHTWRFELKRADGGHRSDDHPHFVCARCGALVCLPRDSVRVQAAPRAPKALASGDFEIQIKGRCDRCA